MTFQTPDPRNPLFPTWPAVSHTISLVQEEDGGQENALVAAERARFAKRLSLREGLTRARSVLKAIKSDAFAGDDDLEQLTSLRAVMEALLFLVTSFAHGFATRSGRSWRRPRPASPAKSQGRLRTLRLKRQKQLLDVSCEFAIHFT